MHDEEMDDVTAQRLLGTIDALTRNVLLRAERNRFQADMRFMAFEDFAALHEIPRFGSDGNFVHALTGNRNVNICQPYHQFERCSTAFIFVSHRWLTPDMAHPDDTSMRKHELICAAVRRLMGPCIPKEFNVALWVDFSCVNQDGAPAAELEERMADLIGLCDLLITPVVDPSHDEWDLPFSFLNPIDDYQAPHWREYWSRAWCRVEAFLAAVVPHSGVEGTFNERSKLFRGGLQNGLAAGRRPHVIFGTKEMEQERPPLFLPPMLGVTFRRYEPADGMLTKDADRPVIRALTEKAREHVIDEKVGYSGERCSERNVPHGKGRMVYEDGHIYVGEWSNGRPHGTGKYTYAWGDEWSGTWHDGDARGHCLQIYPDGGRFEGELSNSKRNGCGHFRYSNGDWLHAEYLNDKKEYGQRFCHDGTFVVVRWVWSEDECRSVIEGEGVQFNPERTTAWRLIDGEEDGEIDLAEACKILDRFGYVPLVPPIYRGGEGHPPSSSTDEASTLDIAKLIREPTDFAAQLRLHGHNEPPALLMLHRSK